MRFSEYIKDKILICLLHLLCMILLMGFFYITGYNRNAAALILIFWWIILGIWIVTGYYRRKKYFDRAEHILENVDQRYLLGELLPASPYLEDRIYRELIRRSNKSVIERIRMLEDEQNDYRDYIESWVHEIKAPITSIQLACENHKDEVTRQIGLENQRIENDVDMVLYYARMEKVYKDYMIEETDLGKAASEILIKNKYYLISSTRRAVSNSRCSSPLTAGRKPYLRSMDCNASTERRRSKLWSSLRPYSSIRTDTICICSRSMSRCLNT